ncbi:hypothetical protein ANN_26867 [Periplaneta americana]|uniref:t-SNARE coiled-coil homology domain-containing protein n=1 Tax=Periplaneta americana TaxID=6978 RepID=A0ABQ8RZE9_PERAM|nr:hypothetical protein ANN_26867 [Periplaneta americana]
MKPQEQENNLSVLEPLLKKWDSQDDVSPEKVDVNCFVSDCSAMVFGKSPDGRKRVRRRPGGQFSPIPRSQMTPFEGASVIVWVGGINIEAHTELTILVGGSLTARCYVEEVLWDHVVPFAQFTVGIPRTGSGPRNGYKDLVCLGDLQIHFLQFPHVQEAMWGRRRNEDILENLKVTLVLNYIQDYQKNWQDHLNRMPRTRIPKRQWKMQKERLADEFTSALNLFQATQRKAAQKEKEQMQRVRANSGLGDPFGGSRYSEQLIELQDNTGQQDAQMMDEMNLQMLEEQEQAIRQLESDISDVNQIFKELGAMVHEQGEVIDSIEASVEKTEVFVNEGTANYGRPAITRQVDCTGPIRWPLQSPDLNPGLLFSGDSSRIMSMRLSHAPFLN